MDITTLSAAARRFPLLGRPRPACPPLPERVKEICEIASTAGQQGADVMHHAAHALNKAALLASDCGLEDLARDLCWQHINLYRVAGLRLTVRQARYMLEPVLNLARLQIRADAGGQALRLLEAMYQAVTANTDLVVDRNTLPLANLTGTRQEHRNLREWVWMHYLADGIRALALAGRWDDAVAHAEAHRGIGRHLMEGRQATIIAHCLHGALPTARAVLADSTPTQPWEHQVASCLNVMCADPNRASISQEVAAMVRHFLEQEPVPGYAVFRARLGLTVVSLAGAADPEAADGVLARVTAEAIEAGDGYAARDMLGYLSTRTGLTNMQRDALSELVTRSGLGSGTLPESLLNSLVNSAEVAKEALAASMVRPDRPAIRP
ncbi:hypothetical protein AB0B89_04490 [Sphaerisporangium sp. NPDC049002]|uniref:hypothetical protein n=1 Tax=unclassified Sphaerisporangium TaxID=2630420 RepID=UPI0033EFB8A2